MSNTLMFAAKVGSMIGMQPVDLVGIQLDANSGASVLLLGERSALHRLLPIVIGGAECLRFVDPLGTPIGPGIGRLHGVWIDRDSRTVWIDAQRLDPPLSDRQLRLLELLDAHANHIVSRDMIVDQVWSDVAADGVSAEAIDSLVKRVRARLRPLQMDGEYIEVFRGRGVRLNRNQSTLNR